MVRSVVRVRLGLGVGIGGFLRVGVGARVGPAPPRAVP
jgi:hypothetical protein